MPIATGTRERPGRVRDWAHRVLGALGWVAPVLRWMVPHLARLPQVAAVTGNPRVANTRTLLCRLQSVEFSATVSVLRRAQTTWGAA